MQEIIHPAVVTKGVCVTENPTNTIMMMLVVFSSVQFFFFFFYATNFKINAICKLFFKCLVHLAPVKINS